jgi:hypothetical protein
MKGLLAIGVLVLGACSTAEEPPPNHPPFVVNSAPVEGSIITLGSGSEREISATLADENVADHLFTRLLIDYPANGDPGRLIRSLELPPSGTRVRNTMRVQPSCGAFGATPGIHRLMLSVSDRPFLDPAAGEDVDPEAPLDSVGVAANRVRVVWLLNCP